MKELIEIQAELKAPKNQYNKFGNYSYRSCEDILEGVKPLLKAQNCTLTMSDEICNIGQHNYVVTHATLTNSEGAQVVVMGSAKEAISQKGMSDAQVTGSTSSYARKYALNGLFCIDDTKDDDSRQPEQGNNQPQTPPSVRQKPKKTQQINKVTPPLLNIAQGLYEQIKEPSQAVSEWISSVEHRDFNDINKGISQMKDLIKKQG